MLSSPEASFDRTRTSPSNMDSPQVSICIPTYNYARIIGDALRSALEQSCRNLEILVVDDASSDDTESLVRDIAAGDARVRYVRHAENIGLSRNFSACISLAKGEFVQILCADDVLEPGCATALGDALHSNREAVLAACGRILTDENLKPVRVVRARKRREVVPGQALLHECFVYSNLIGEPTAVMFRRAAASRGFRPDYSQAVDLEMWMHLLTQGAGILLPEPLCRVRRHATQASHENVRSGRVVEDKQRLFRDYGPALSGELSLTEKLMWDARMAFSIQRVQAAVRRLNVSDPTEVFFPGVFRRVMLPASALAKRLVHAPRG
jgi:glycosyltransferase involved in cell wall biosynthesis